MNRKKEQVNNINSKIAAASNYTCTFLQTAKRYEFQSSQQIIIQRGI